MIFLDKSSQKVINRKINNNNIKVSHIYNLKCISIAAIVMAMLVGIFFCN